jgi:hypothetical protein
LEDRRLMSRFTHDHDPLLSPPAHVLAEVDAAWERAQDLFAGELELHFERSATGRRVTGELRQPGGDVVECLSAGEALALACGDVALVLAA